jgi:precorrin-6B methylase 2
LVDRGEHLTLHFSALGDAPVLLRPGTDDLQLAHRVFVKEHHLPPPELEEASVRIIWDVGASVGLTAAHFAARFRDARVMAIEPDPSAAELCRANLTHWGDRCEVVQTAITPGALAGLAPPTRAVDYVRLGAAGAERDLLREDARWTDAVRAMKVEVSPAYTLEECVEDLRRLGFATSSDSTAPRVVSAVRRA